MSTYDLIKESIITGFIEKENKSLTAFQPKLLVNSREEGKKVLSSVINELKTCTEFKFSVAFVTSSGIATLKETLLQLKILGVKGTIIASQYQNFTQPKALMDLVTNFPEIDLYIATEGNLHTKGYIFKKSTEKDGSYTMIVGSSNLTADALCSNNEWNLMLSSTNQGSLIDATLLEFEKLRQSSTQVDTAWINEYEKIYREQKRLFDDARNNEELTLGLEELKKIVPNKMQKEALLRIEALRAEGKKKALLISATGTGKTYLSAFDVSKVNPKRFLFVIHRENIARVAMKSYKKIFGKSKTMGLFTGNIKDREVDFMFATIQTLSKDGTLESFTKDYFDYIVFDEAHHAIANTYLKVLDYFTPKFLLGMTATPERTDGYDIFSKFDHNIAYEIRLQKALEENMLSPFHYYGVRDIEVNGVVLNEDADFNYLVSHERVHNIIQKSKLYGCDQGRIKGLIFCSRVDEAESLSEKLTAEGYKIIALSGKSTQEERDKSIELLESNDPTKYLDYIISVDVFNEGVDIKSVNQIIMLRPTQSAIIFVQQLGRGLRKNEGKEYVTVIDFIGNYQSNYLVPVALYGDGSYNKDRLRKLIAGGSAEIPGASTVNFDSVSMERIFKAIDVANMSKKKDLDNDYNLLKYKLGRIPLMMDFVEYGSRDPFLYVTHAKSYFNYIESREDSFKGKLTGKQKKYLEVFASEIANGKRYEEMFLMISLLDMGELSYMKLVELSKNCQWIYPLEQSSFDSSLRNLNMQFVTEKYNGKQISVSEKHKILTIDMDIYRSSKKIIFNPEFMLWLKNEDFTNFLMDNINFAVHQYKQGFVHSIYNDGFVLYKKYSRKDVFRILNWDVNPVAQNVGGYMISKDKSNCAIFVNYHKEEEINSTIKYNDEFITSERFQWMSKSKRTLNSPDVSAIAAFKEHHMRLPLFIKKHNDEGAEFYYMGDVEPLPELFEEDKMPDGNGKFISVVKMMVNLKIPVTQELYDYITNK